jgi:Zn-dependent protease with chaperone function
MSGSEHPAGDAGAAPARLAARWFDGRQARGLDATLTMHAGELHLHTADAAPPARYPREAVRWPERTRHGAVQLLLPDGGVVEVRDAVAWDAWAGLHGIRQPASVRWASSWRATVLAMLTMLVALFAGAHWGIPWASEQLAPRVPQAAREHLDRLVMEQMREAGWLKPHGLAPDVARRLQAQADRMVEAAYPAGQRPRVQVAVHRLPEWLGPNAFALPGGQVVISEALLKLLPMQGAQFHPGVLGVLAHEIGHVAEHHGLRQLLASSATGALLGWWIGDYSAVLAGAPALLMKAAYSRSFEREADDQALHILRAAGIDPRGMVQFFQALQRAEPGRRNEGPSFGLGTHPPDEERIRLFETGTR